jgi:uncharacterized C2H2 Zn-finger protein
MLSLSELLSLNEDELAKYLSKKPFRGADTFGWDDGDGKENAPKFERDLFNALRNWGQHSNKTVATFFYSKKDILDRAKKKYPKLFQPPIGLDAYRGVNIDFKSLVKQINKQGGLKKIDRVWISGVDYYIIASKYLYKPHKPATSWTTDQSTADSFSSNAILHTKIDKDFYFHPRMLNKYIGLGEDETILLSTQRYVTVLLPEADLIDIISRISKLNKGLKSTSFT